MDDHTQAAKGGGGCACAMGLNIMQWAVSMPLVRVVDRSAEEAQEGGGAGRA